MSLKHVTICDHCGAAAWSDEVDWTVRDWRPAPLIAPPALSIGSHSHDRLHLCDECVRHVWPCRHCRDFHLIGEACPRSSTVAYIPQVPRMFGLLDADDGAGATPGVSTWRSKRTAPPAPPRPPSPRASGESHPDYTGALVLGILAFVVLLLATLFHWL